jgi:hypothetical protein
MTVATQKYVLVAGGGPVIFDPALAFTTVLRVVLEGLGYNDCAGAASPANREYCFDYAAGTITFQDFGDGGPGPTDNINRKALVIYKY